MSNGSYPRPASDPGVTSGRPSGGDIVAASIWGLAILAGLLSSFEVLVVGEELSTLGDRLHTYFSQAGLIGNAIGKAEIGLLVFGFSVLRIIWTVGFCLNQKWTNVAGRVLAVPFVLIDVVCWSTPLAIGLVASDLFGWARCFAKDRR